MSQEYEKGFAQGEQDAFRDRQQGIYMMGRPERIKSERSLGYWDAYEPRSSTWIRKIDKTRCED